MPSGPKKRKAAKRKKEMDIHHNHRPDSPNQGNGDHHLSGHDDDAGKESEGGSPMSHENHSLTDEEKEDCLGSGGGVAAAADRAMESAENCREEPKEERVAVVVAVEEILSKPGDVRVKGDDGSSNLEGEPWVDEGSEKMKSAMENCVGFGGVASDRAMQCSVNGKEEPKEEGKAMAGAEILSKAGDVSVEFVSKPGNVRVEFVGQPEKGYVTVEGIVSKPGDERVEFVGQPEKGDDGSSNLEGEPWVDEGSELKKSAMENCLGFGGVVADRAMQCSENGREEPKEEGKAMAGVEILSKAGDVSMEFVPCVSADRALQCSENGREEPKYEGNAMAGVEILSKARDVRVEFVPSEKGDDGGGILEGEARIDGGSKKMELEKSTEKNYLGSGDVAAANKAMESLENCREHNEEGVALAAEEILSKAGDDGVGNLEGESRIDEGSKEMELEKSAESNLIPIEQSVPVIEEVTQGGKAPSVNLKSFNDAVDTSSHEREVKVLPRSDETGETFSDAARTENASATEVARAPLVVHRASLWSCCGLLDVLMGSQR